MWHLLLIGFGAWIFRYNYTEFTENNMCFWQPMIAAILGALFILGSFRCIFNILTSPVRGDVYYEDRGN